MSIEILRALTARYVEQEQDPDTLTRALAVLAGVEPIAAAPPAKMSQETIAKMLATRAANRKKREEEAAWAGRDQK